MEDERTIYIAIDMHPNQFGGVIGELNRTGWTITGAEDLDEERRGFTSSVHARDARWQRVYAKRDLGNQPLQLGP